MAKARILLRQLGKVPDYLGLTRGSVKGVPFPPPNLVDMHATAAEGFQHGRRLVGRCVELGLDLNSGPLLDIGCGWGRFAYALLDAG
ncbi:MAG: hypothetical protein AAF441_23650 [Pseudomonadota bacterium]